MFCCKGAGLGLIFSLGLFLINLPAQTPDWQIDHRAQSIRLGKLGLIQLTDSLTAPYATDREKVRAIFSWITDNIAYDCHFQNARDPLMDDVDRLTNDIERRLAVVLKNKRALCGGYAFLFKTMCDLAEVQARVVEGKAYGGHTPAEGHAWNAVRLDDQWYWLDATWSSGTCSNGRFQQQYQASWYLTSVTRMLRSHRPTEDFWLDEKDGE